MEYCLCLDKKDIITSRLGNNIQVRPNEMFSISFTPAALEELIQDYKDMQAAEAKPAGGCCGGGACSLPVKTYDGPPIEITPRIESRAIKIDFSDEQIMGALSGVAAPDDK